MGNGSHQRGLVESAYGQVHVIVSIFCNVCVWFTTLKFRNTNLSTHTHTRARMCIYFKYISDIYTICMIHLHMHINLF